MLLKNATIATMNPDTDYGLIPDGAVAIDGERIVWVGPKAEVPAEFGKLENVDLGGRLLTPSLVDCHTHIVHGGNRAREFEMRLNGASYEDIARAGGGIISTVRATRDASEETLLKNALVRIDTLIAEGVTTLEIKSGYGLDRETELRMLRVARQIADLRPIRIRTSFLGAHAVPPEYAGRPDDYLTDICLPTLKDAATEGLVDAVDGFCENIAFTPAQIARVFDTAKELGLSVKLHAEQLSHLGGGALVSARGGLSADHLEHATAEDAKSLADAGVVAVLLPGAFYTLRETKMPPIDAFRRAGTAMALATDSNPGSSPVTSLLLIMNMACTLFRMTPAEALAGVTRNGARALGLTDIGEIRPGFRADLAAWDVEHPAELSYRAGFNPLARSWFRGRA